MGTARAHRRIRKRSHRKDTGPETCPRPKSHIFAKRNHWVSQTRGAPQPSCARRAPCYFLFLQVKTSVVMRVRAGVAWRHPSQIAKTNRTHRAVGAPQPCSSSAGSDFPVWLALSQQSLDDLDRLSAAAIRFCSAWISGLLPDAACRSSHQTNHLSNGTAPRCHRPRRRAIQYSQLIWHEHVRSPVSSHTGCPAFAGHDI